MKTDYQKIAELLYKNNKYTVNEIEKMYPKRNLKPGAEVTRFAPSPTGFLHLGHFFQTVIDKFLALRSGGIFYYRLEDTDKKREVEGADKFAYDKICEYGFVPDEGWTVDGEKGNYGPYRQSERIEIYKAYGKMLVEKGNAFPCFCDAPENKEEILESREKQLEETSTLLDHDPCRDLSYEEVKANIDAGKTFALRLRSKNREGDKIKIIDKVRGERELPANLRDAVLIKSDGIPPYPFAHPIDDHLMHTTTVVRGEEWFPSVALHTEIFDALGFERVSYLHTAVISKIDEKTGNKRKFSKRLDPEFNINYFDEQGYPKTAVLEYVLTLANSNFEDWRKANPDANLFVFPFTIEKMGTNSPMFDLVKLGDISKNVFSRMKASEVYTGALEWAKTYNKKFYELLTNNRDLAIKALNIDREIQRPRKDISKYSDIEPLYSYMFDELFDKSTLLNFDEKLMKETIKEFLSEYKKVLNLNENKDEWFNKIKEVANNCGFATDNKLYKQNPTLYKGNTADACNIIRVSITGRSQTPDLYSIMVTLGQNKVLERINYVLNNLK